MKTVIRIGNRIKQIHEMGLMCVAEEFKKEVERLAGPPHTGWRPTPARWTTG